MKPLSSANHGSFFVHDCMDNLTLKRFSVSAYGGGGGGTTRPLPRDGGAEELRGDPIIRPHPKVWTIDQE